MPPRFGGNLRKGHAPRRIVGALDPTGVDLERTFFDLVLAVDEADDGPVE
jgi:hypothetical protein